VAYDSAFKEAAMERVPHHLVEDAQVKGVGLVGVVFNQSQGDESEEIN